MGRDKKRTANNRVVMNTVTTVSDWSLTLLRKCWKLFQNVHIRVSSCLKGQIYTTNVISHLLKAAPWGKNFPGTSV